MKKYVESIYTILIWFSGLIALCILLLILGHIFVRGIGSITPEFIFGFPSQMGKEGGVFPVIVATFYLTILAVIIATPLGVGTAVYLTQYAKSNLFARVIMFVTESLAGVPSIIFGLFGFAFFVVFLKLGWSVLSGALTLAIMILPTIIRTSQHSIDIVPREYRDGSLALGASRYQTIMRIIIPSALPGIMVGVILGIGRAIGETAAVMYTAGGALRLPITPLEPARNLSYHLYLLAAEVGAVDKAYSSALVLVIMILIINSVVNWIEGRLVIKER